MKPLSPPAATAALRVLVIDESHRRGAELCAGLAMAGCQVAAVLAGAEDLARQVEAVKPDMILIGTDNPSRDTLEHLAAMNRDMPRPVVIFADEGDQNCIRNAMKAGVAAYVVDGLEPARVKPVIDVALARFEADQALKRELETTQKKLSERRLVEQAKGLLMKLKGLDEDQAYKLLRKLAMDRGQPIGTVAQNVLETARLLL